MNDQQVRWLVRREQVGTPAKFGDRRDSGILWAVRAYTRMPGRRRVLHAGGTFYPSLQAAVDYARRECARVYGCPTPTHQHRRSR